MAVTILTGDCVESLARLPAGTFQTCVTSPPYYGLRDYGHAGQIGLEDSPDAYVARLVGVFREVRRVLREDGTLFLNLGDSYARAGGEGACGPNAAVGNTQSGQQRRMLVPPQGYKPKDLLGIPWQVAFALRADGWWLRSAIVWAKPNPMPESVRDRPTGDHVMDPFGGAGTTGLVADRLGRKATLCELNPEYARLARERITSDAPLLAGVA